MSAPVIALAIWLAVMGALFVVAWLAGPALARARQGALESAGVPADRYMRHLNIRMAVNALCIVPLIGTASVLAWPLNFGLSILALAGAGFVGSMLAQLVLRFLDQRGSTKGIVSDEAKVKHAMQQGAR